MSVAALAPTSTFWLMFHSLLKEDDNDASALKATKACAWLSGELHIVRRYCSNAEIDLLALVHDHWAQHHEPPSYELILHYLQTDDRPTLEEYLEEYNQVRSDLKQYDVPDLGALLSKKVDEFESARLDDLIKVTKAINTTGVELKRHGEVTRLKGPRDATRYFMERLESTAMFTQGRVSKGVVQENASDLFDVYQENKNPASKKRKILTGIHEIDEVLGSRKGHFVGILGYAGQRKTSLARTWCYNAALAGNNILHVTLEQTYEEELIMYSLIHSHHPKWGGRFNISAKQFDDGLLSKEEEDFLFHEVIPDMQENIPGKIIIRQPTEGTTWDSIKNLLYITDRETPVDVFLIDYLTICSTKSTRDHVAEMELAIKDAKLLSLTFRGNEGLLIITPVQGNRDGWIDAGKNEGKWETTGIFRYSEFDKSLDALLSVYLDDDLKADGQIIISSAKTRRAEGVKPFRAAMSAAVGKISNLRTGSTSSIDLDGIIDDL